MNIPKVEHKAGVYHLMWQDEQIVARVDRLHTEKGGVYGELLLKTTAPAGPTHLHGPVHFNFIATTARSTIIRHLQTVVEAPWVPMIEQLCYIVVEMHRKGEPTIHIADHKPPDSLGMRVNPILAEKKATVFFGEGDSLKSFFSTYLAVTVCLGQPRVGLIPEPGRVLYLDYEEDADTFWERVLMISEGLNSPLPEGLYYRHMVEPLTAEFPRLNAAVSEYQIDLVIVDSAAPATIEPEKAEIVTAFFACLRALDVTSITIAHMTKTAKGEYPFGSVFWRNLPRANYKITADRNQENIAIALRQTKSNNGRRLSPLGYEFVFGEHSVAVDKATPVEYENLRDGIPVWQQIESLIRHGKLSSQRIAEELGIEENNVRAVLSRYRNKSFVKVGEEWGLISNADG